MPVADGHEAETHATVPHTVQVVVVVTYTAMQVKVADTGVVTAESVATAPRRSARYIEKPSIAIYLS